MHDDALGVFTVDRPVTTVHVVMLLETRLTCCSSDVESYEMVYDEAQRRICSQTSQRAFHMPDDAQPFTRSLIGCKDLSSMEIPVVQTQP